MESNDIRLSHIRKVGDFENNKVENELVFFLPVGCFWARILGGCYHCGYQVVIDEINKKYYYDLVEIVKVEYKKYLNVDIKRVFFYVGGAFFEIEDKIQNEILSFIDSKPLIRDIYIESRPEFITTGNIERLKLLLHDKNLIVAMGLETYSERVRNGLLNKGISNTSFQFAMDLLQRENIKALIYIFIKPPIKNNSDKKAYEEALKSVDFAVQKGASYIELKCGDIMPNTKLYELYKKGEYEPINIWMANQLLAVVSNKYKNIPIRLGGIEERVWKGKI